MLQEIIGKLITGERDGTTLWKIAINDIAYSPITDSSEGVWVASLAENILRVGQLEPILLYRLRSREQTDAHYQLITGRRRLEALRMLGRTHVSAIVVACEEEQLPFLALSDNLVRREPDYLTAASQISALLSENWTVAKLAPLLAESEESLTRLLALLQLAPEELRLLRLCGLGRIEATRLLDLPAPLRRAVLEKCYADPTCTPSALIEEAIRNPDPRITQSEKVWVTDVRIFLNTLRRAMETMQKAGYDGSLQESEDAESYLFQIRVAKKLGKPLKSQAHNVSRETSAQSDRKVSRETLLRNNADRFASVRSIFEAIAADERAFGKDDGRNEDVSRETYANRVYGEQENAEKLEICIDEPLKK